MNYDATSEFRFIRDFLAKVTAKKQQIRDGWIGQIISDRPISSRTLSLIAFVFTNDRYTQIAALHNEQLNVFFYGDDCHSVWAAFKELAPDYFGVHERVMRIFADPDFAFGPIAPLVEYKAASYLCSIIAQNDVELRKELGGKKFDFPQWIEEPISIIQGEVSDSLLIGRRTIADALSMEPHIWDQVQRDLAGNVARFVRMNHPGIDVMESDIKMQLTALLYKSTARDKIWPDERGVDPLTVLPSSSLASARRYLTPKEYIELVSPHKCADPSLTLSKAAEAIGKPPSTLTRLYNADGDFARWWDDIENRYRGRGPA